MRLVSMFMNSNIFRLSAPRRGMCSREARNAPTDREADMSTRLWQRTSLAPLSELTGAEAEAVVGGTAPPPRGWYFDFINPPIPPIVVPIDLLP
jgi:hypothetical protein